MLNFRKKLILISILSLSPFLILKSYGKDNFTPKVLVENNNWQANINLDCLDINKECGKVNFKDLNCSANLKLIKENNYWYIFNEEISSGECEKGCYLYINKEFNEYREVCGGSISGKGNLIISSTNNTNINNTKSNASEIKTDLSYKKFKKSTKKINASSNLKKNKSNKEVRAIEDFYYASKDKNTGKYGFRDYAGNIVIPAQFDDATYFSEGLAGVKIGGQWGYIDKKGKLIIPTKFNEALGFSEGLAAIRKGGWGYIDKKGNSIIASGNNMAESFKNGFAVVCISGEPKYAFIDKKDRIWLGNRSYDYARTFSEGLALVSNNNKYGYINQEGLITIPIKFDYADSFSSYGTAIVSYNNKYGAINKKGDYIIEPIFEEIKYFSDDFAIVKLDGKYGIIDNNGGFLINPIFENVKEFSEGLAPAKINGKWGFVDQKNNIIVKATFEDLQSFSEGLAPAKLNGKWGLIDKKGKTITSYKFDKLLYGFNGFDDFVGFENANDKRFIISRNGSIPKENQSAYENEYKNIISIAEKNNFLEAIKLTKEVSSKSPYKKLLDNKLNTWVSLQKKQKDEEERKKYQVGSRVFWYAHILNVADEDMGLGINFEGKIIERVGKNKLKVKVVNGKVKGGNTWGYQIKAAVVLEDFIGRVIIIAPNGVNNIQTNMRGGG